MSKILTSFRLPEKTHENLKLLGENHKASQAEIIEAMVELAFKYGEDYKYNLDVILKAKRLEKNPQYQEIMKNLEEKNNLKL